MTAAEFTEALRNGLPGLPREDLEERLAFYAEMIEDRMEEGLTEEEAVAGLGPVEEVIGQIVLLVLGSPIWLSMLIAAAAVLFSLYVTVWAVVISLWAVDLSLAAGAAACIAGGVLFLLKGRLIPACCSLGAALFCAAPARSDFFPPPDEK